MSLDQRVRDAIEEIMQTPIISNVSVESVMRNGRRRERARRALAAAFLCTLAFGIVGAAAWLPIVRSNISPAAPLPIGTEFRGNQQIPFRGGQLVTPEPGKSLTLGPRPWALAVLIEDQTLEVSYTGGLANCYALRDVRVEETARTVTVTLIEGTLTTACLLPGVQYRTQIRLKEPLGARTVVDGSPPQS